MADDKARNHRRNRRSTWSSTGEPVMIPAQNAAPIAPWKPIEEEDLPTATKIVVPPSQAKGPFMSARLFLPRAAKEKKEDTRNKNNEQSHGSSAGAHDHRQQHRADDGTQKRGYSQGDHRQKQRADDGTQKHGSSLNNIPSLKSIWYGSNTSPSTLNLLKEVSSVLASDHQAADQSIAAPEEFVFAKPAEVRDMRPPPSELGTTRSGFDSDAATTDTFPATLHSHDTPRWLATDDDCESVFSSQMADNQACASAKRADSEVYGVSSQEILTGGAEANGNDSSDVDTEELEKYNLEPVLAEQHKSHPPIASPRDSMSPIGARPLPVNWCKVTDERLRKVEERNRQYDARFNSCRETDGEKEEEKEERKRRRDPNLTDDTSETSSVNGITWSLYSADAMAAAGCVPQFGRLSVADGESEGEKERRKKNRLLREDKEKRKRLGVEGCCDGDTRGGIQILEDGAEYPFIDSHCHLDFTMDSLRKEAWHRRAVVEDISSIQQLFTEHMKKPVPRMLAGCIPNWINPAVFVDRTPNDPLVNERDFNPYFAINIAKDPMVLGQSFGCHPHKIDQADELFFMTLEHLIGCRHMVKLVAIGECGVDLSGKNSHRLEDQLRVFRRQVQIAVNYNLPIIIHCREGQGEQQHVKNPEHAVLSVLLDECPPNHPIHRHCFTRDADTARMWMKALNNVYFGFTPGVRIEQSSESYGALKVIPVKQIVLETDSPFFRPYTFTHDSRSSHMGAAFAAAQKIAAVKGVHVNEVLKHSYANTKRLYGLGNLP